MYVTTQDGVFNETLYASVNATSAGLFYYIDVIGGYFNQYHVADPNAYIIFDELKINNAYIGPPAGFVSGSDTTPPAVPSGLRVE